MSTRSSQLTADSQFGFHAGRMQHAKTLRPGERGTLPHNVSYMTTFSISESIGCTERRNPCNIDRILSLGDGGGGRPPRFKTKCNEKVRTKAPL